MELTEPEGVALFVMLVVLCGVLACVRFGPRHRVDEDDE